MDRAAATDAPIYIYICFRDTDYKPLQKNSIRNRPYLKNQLIVVDDDNHVQNFDLPDFGQKRFYNPGIAVADNRLFIIGGIRTQRNGEQDLNGILSANIYGGDTDWETKPVEDPPEELSFLQGAAVSGKGDCIYAIGGGHLLVFDCKNRILKENVSGAPSETLPVLLAATDTRIYANCLSLTLTDPFADDLRYSTLGYYDIDSLEWNTIYTNERLLWHLERKVVVVRDLYLIDFSLWHPLTLEFRPALYVYDILQRKWLTHPVQGLDNDDSVLPTLEAVDYGDELYIPSRSLMQIRRDELKFALVWHNLYLAGKYKLHLSKFTLTIQEGVYEDADADAVPPTSKNPTFKAENLLSFSPYCGTGEPCVHSMTAYY